MSKQFSPPEQRSAIKHVLLMHLAAPVATYAMHAFVGLVLALMTTAWLGAAYAVGAAIARKILVHVGHGLLAEIETLTPRRFSVQYAGVVLLFSAVTQGLWVYASLIWPTPPVLLASVLSAFVVTALAVMQTAPRPAVLAAQLALPVVQIFLAVAIVAQSVALNVALGLWLIVVASVATVALVAFATNKEVRRTARLRLKRRALMGELQAKTDAAIQDKLRVEMAIASARTATWDIDFSQQAIISAGDLERILGQSINFADLVSGKLSRLVAPEHRELIRAMFSDMRATPEKRCVEHRIVRDDGSDCWVRTHATSIAGPDGVVTRLLMLTTDITAEKHAADELKAQKQRAEAASLAKTQFLATMSHEIRTPMNGVLGMAELLRRTNLTAQQRLHVDTLIDSGEVLMAILNDILDLSKIEAGAMSLSPTPVLLSDFTHAAMRIWRPRAADKGLTLSVIGADAAHVWLAIDPVRLNQILFNLIGNAIKFTERGEITITLAVDPVCNGKRAVSIAVRDTGIGMSEDDMAGLFQKFAQADASTTRRFGGTGLGLVISRSLAQMMDGDITVASTPGAGSTFTLHTVLEEAAAPEMAIAAGAGPGEAPKALSILAVDDHHVNRTIITALMEQFGNTVDLACDGAEGVAMASTRPFDLILMDIQMPGMDGEQALAAIRAGPGPNRATPIIALTANAMAADRERYLRLGFQDHVAKPIDVRVLASAIAKAVAARSLAA